MKLSKILLTAVAAVSVIGFASCGGNSITGGGKKYKINLTNESETEVKRYYNDTATKHAGGLVKITFNSDCINNKSTDNAKTYGTGMMGTIFGFEDSVDENATKGSHDFYIIGISDEGNYYVSRYVNIKDSDLEQPNFGATAVDSIDTSSGKPQEKVYIALASSTKTSLDKDDDGNKYIYLYERALKDGSYDWAVLKMTDEQVKSFNIDTYSTSGSYKDCATVVNSGNIPNAFTAVESESKITQKKLAVYANVYQTNTLVGEWYYIDMYKEAEVIE